MIRITAWSIESDRTNFNRTQSDFPTMCGLSRYSELVLQNGQESRQFVFEYYFIPGESNIKSVRFTRLECLELKICAFSKPRIPSILTLESGETHDPNRVQLNFNRPQSTEFVSRTCD